MKLRRLRDRWVGNRGVEGDWILRLETRRAYYQLILLYAHSHDRKQGYKWLRFQILDTPTRHLVATVRRSFTLYRGGPTC